MIGLEKKYSEKFDWVLQSLASNLESHTQGLFANEPRIDRISARAKSVERFIGKANTRNSDGSPKYSDPLRQIQDQIGARIITFYRSDIDRVSNVVERYFKPIETQEIVPDSEWKFGYFGKHYILFIPSDVIDPNWEKELIPEFFELQVKTLFEHAWSEANHDLSYKPEIAPLEGDELRQLAFTSAQAWGADNIFDKLFRKKQN